VPLTHLLEEAVSALASATGTPLTDTALAQATNTVLGSLSPTDPSFGIEARLAHPVTVGTSQDPNAINGPRSYKDPKGNLWVAGNLVQSYGVYFNNTNPAAAGNIVITEYLYPAQPGDLVSNLDPTTV